MKGNHIFEPRPEKKAHLWYELVCLVIAILYGLLVASFPMENIVDRENYLIYAESSLIIIARYLNQGILSFLSNEPLWLFTNVLLSQFGTPEQTIRLVTGISGFIIAFKVLRFNPKYFVFLFFLLLLPQVMKNHVVHLRQGLAISVFIMGWYLDNKRLRILLIGITPLIHSSFFFVLFLFGVNWFLSKIRFAIDLKAAFFISVSIILGLSFEVISSLLGSRQANLYTEGASVSGFGFLFWLSILTIYLLEGKKFAQKHAFVISVLIFYLCTYFLFGATARVFESALLLIVLAGLSLTNWRKQAFYITSILYFIFQFGPRIMQPYLGWLN